VSLTVLVGQAIEEHRTTPYFAFRNIVREVLTKIGTWYSSFSSTHRRRGGGSRRGSLGTDADHKHSEDAQHSRTPSGARKLRKYSESEAAGRERRGSSDGAESTQDAGEAAIRKGLDALLEWLPRRRAGHLPLLNEVCGFNLAETAASKVYSVV
jgi:hypothetical protein